MFTTNTQSCQLGSWTSCVKMCSHVQLLFLINHFSLDVFLMIPLFHLIPFYMVPFFILFFFIWFLFLIFIWFLFSIWFILYDSFFHLIHFYMIPFFIWFICHMNTVFCMWFQTIHFLNCFHMIQFWHMIDYDFLSPFWIDKWYVFSHCIHLFTCQFSSCRAG